MLVLLLLLCLRLTDQSLGYIPIMFDWMGRVTDFVLRVCFSAMLYINRHVFGCCDISSNDAHLMCARTLGSWLFLPCLTANIYIYIYIVSISFAKILCWSFTLCLSSYICLLHLFKANLLKLDDDDDVEVLTPGSSDGNVSGFVNLPLHTLSGFAMDAEPGQSVLVVTNQCHLEIVQVSGVLYHLHAQLVSSELLEQKEYRTMSDFKCLVCCIDGSQCVANILVQWCYICVLYLAPDFYSFCDMRWTHNVNQSHALTHLLTNDNLLALCTADHIVNMYLCS